MLAPDDFSLLDQRGKESREAPHSLRVKVLHPEFSTAELRDGHQDWRSLLRARTAEIVLLPDTRITGRILDAEGNPIPNASIRELLTTGRNGNETRSQDDGRFAIYLKSGSHRLLVEKEGFASEALPTSATRTEETRIEDISLATTAPLRIRIVDAEGAAVSGVSFHAEFDLADSSSNLPLRRFETDEKGEVLWSSPPASGIPWLHTAFKSGYFAQRDQKVEIEDNRLLVTVRKAITVTGRISDSDTGKSIEKFKLVESQRLSNGERVWYSEETRPTLDREGRFRFSIDEYDRTVFRVEAEGYLARESRDFDPEGKERTATEDFALESIPTGNTKEVRLLGPDGRTPAAGASLTLRQNGAATLAFRDLSHPENLHPPTSVTTADGSGILPFLKTPPPHSGWLTHPMGYLPVETTDLKKGQTQALVLLPYRSVEGILTVDGAPGASRTLMLQTSLPRLGREDRADFWAVTVRTDAAGNFSSDQLVPSENPYRIRLVDEKTGEDYPDTITFDRVGEEKNAPLSLAAQDAPSVHVRGRFVTNRGEPLDGTHLLFATLFVNPAHAAVEFFDTIQPETDGSFETRLICLDDTT